MSASLMSASGVSSSAEPPGIAPDRVVAGIGFDAAATAAAAQRPVGPVDHMAEFAARRMRAGEKLAFEDKPMPMPCDRRMAMKSSR